MCTPHRGHPTWGPGAVSVTASSATHVISIRFSPGATRLSRANAEQEQKFSLRPERRHLCNSFFPPVLQKEHHWRHRDPPHSVPLGVTISPTTLGASRENCERGTATTALPRRVCDPPRSGRVSVRLAAVAAYEQTPRRCTGAGYEGKRGSAIRGSMGGARTWS